MARYDVARAWFLTPAGRSVIMHIRESTNDWNTAFSCLNEDEYGLRGRTLTGLGLDAGGHIGGASVAALADNPDLTMVIVEPLPENLELIRANLAVNGLAERARVYAGAIGRSGDSITINYAYDGGENELHHAYIGNSALVAPDVVRKTITYTAVGIADLLGDRMAVWAKVDTEGGEWAFLADPAVAQLEYIVGEWHPTEGHLAPDLVALLSPTHDVTITGPEGGPGGFSAVLR